MKKEITIEYQELASAAELEADDKRLLDEAERITSASHSPYSGFHVGAAVMLGNGEILSAANQENEAFPSGLCAERSVLFYTFSKFPDVPITAIAIVAKRGDRLTDEPTRPCAACIQVMLDAENRAGKPVKIILGSAGKIEVINSVHDLLPFAFNNLK
ncbi:MAG: cytidine deaminase [Candidatus Egerieousia sp.]